MITCTSWGSLCTDGSTMWQFLLYLKPWQSFYQANIDFITEHAVDPDKKRYLGFAGRIKTFFRCRSLWQKAVYENACQMERGC